MTPTPSLVKTSLKIYCSYCHYAVHYEIKEKQLVQLQESTLHFIKRDDPSITSEKLLSDVMRPKKRIWEKLTDDSFRTIQAN